MAAGEEQRGSAPEPGLAGAAPARRTVTYCLLPYELAGKLHELLRSHFRDDSEIEVVVEQRSRERRGSPERRQTGGEPPGGDERRRIRNAAGRRVGEQRARQLTASEIPRLPRRAARHASRLVFVERLEPSAEQLEDLDTARAVIRLQAGDRDAFTVLYMRYFDRVYGYLRTLLRDRHEAEDVTQQVFVQVLEALDRYERRRQPFRAWLFTVVRNRALMHLRKAGRLDVVDPEQISRYREALTPDGGDGIALEWLTDSDLIVLFERLPLAQRQVLMLRYMLGLRVSEVATILGREPNDVSQLHHRALAFLQQRLRALGREPRGERRPRTRRRVLQARVLRSRRFALHL